MTIRLFTALTIPDDLISRISSLPDKGLASPRRTHREDLHITLRFIGDVESEQLPAIEDALARVRRPPFGVVVRGLGLFENRNQSVIYAEIESARKLTALAAEINEKLAPLGFEMPNKPFVPHITLFRLKNPHGARAYVETRGRGFSSSWNAGNFALMQSADAGEGNKRYRVLRSYDLKD